MRYASLSSAFPMYPSSSPIKAEPFGIPQPKNRTIDTTENFTSVDVPATVPTSTTAPTTAPTTATPGPTVCDTSIGHIFRCAECRRAVKKLLVLDTLSQKIDKVLDLIMYIVIALIALYILCRRQA